MTPREFFDSVAKVNAQEVQQDVGEMRKVVNAIITLGVHGHSAGAFVGRRENL
jgi:hypothetical protein